MPAELQFRVYEGLEANVQSLGMPPTGHQVSPERLEELRRIYKEVSGEEITATEATDMAHRLLALYKLISRPLPGENVKTPSLPATKSTLAK